MTFEIEYDFYQWEVCTEKLCQRIIDNLQYETEIESRDELIERIKMEIDFLIDNDYDGLFMRDLCYEFNTKNTNEERINALIDNVNFYLSEV